MNYKERLKFAIDPNNFEKIKDWKPIKGSDYIVTFMNQISTGRRIVQKQSRNKLLRYNSQKCQLTERDFLKEVDILSLFKHPAIVNFIGFSIVDKKGSIYLEYIENGSLDNYIEKNNEDKHNIMNDPLWDDTHKLIISYGIARAMEYLHSQQITHRGLKAENVLLDSELRPFITDFGTKNLLYDSMIPKKIDTIAPEIMGNPSKYQYSKAIDVYSYSMILYYIWVGHKPYDSSFSVVDIVRKVLSNERPEFPSETFPNVEWQDLIKKCWNQDPDARPTFTEICKLIESSKFLTSNINTELFNEYKKHIDESPKTTSNISNELE